MDDQLEKLETLLENDRSRGVLHLGTLSRASIKRARKQTVQRLTPLLTTDHLPAGLLQDAASLDVLVGYRNSQLGLGCLSQGYVLPHLCSSDDYGRLQLGDQVTLWDANPAHTVLVDLLCHRDNRDVLEAYLDAPFFPADRRWMLPFECLKDVLPSSKGTALRATPPHRDIYDGSTRWQGYVNWDDRCKLFFVPGTCGKRASRILDSLSPGTKTNGFRAVECEGELGRILREYAIAPEKGELVMWKPGVVHMEGLAGEETDGWYGMDSLDVNGHHRRVRYFTGAMDVDDYPLDVLRKIALAAERGLTPAWYNGQNKGTILEPLITMRKTTRFLRPRKVQSSERTDRQSTLDWIASLTRDELVRETEQLPVERRRLYGLV